MSFGLFKRLVVWGFAVSCILAACGGGAEQSGSTNLYGAYEVIDKAQGETQVKSIIGSEPAKREQDGETVVILTWETDAGTYRHTTLLVTIKDDVGVTGKVITGYRGNKSQTF